MKKSENLVNKKNMKEIVFSIIDMAEVYYDYQIANEEELVEVKKWNDVIYKFIHNKPIIKRKKKKKVLIEEEIGNANFDIYSPIDEEYSKNFGQYEICELKNYVYKIGNKYDSNKNNLFFKKMNLKVENIEINDVMGEEIQLLFDKAKEEGKDIRDEDDEEEFKRTGKMRYPPSREEEELLQHFKLNIPEYNFTSIISDIIQFGLSKNQNEIFSSNEKLKKEENGEEPKLEDFVDLKINEEEKINESEESKEENKENKENKETNTNEKNDINNDENDGDKLLKDLLNSIPIKISFVGILNNEIKVTIKNSISKYPKMKIYNPIEFLKDLRQKKKRIDEPIDEQNLRKFQIDQLKKEKNNLTEEIKEYIDIVENKDNLSDDEICIKILQKKIKEDFERKNIETIKQEIENRRNNVNNINTELNKVKEEQNKKQKPNLRELQVYQQQLDKIDLEAMAGFVIINFPNNFEQSKLMEEKMINFIEPCEQNKSNSEDINDKLLLLVDREQKDQIFLKFDSFLEKMVYFYCDNSKILSENEIIQKNPPPNTGNAHQNVQLEVFTENQIEEYKNNFKKLEDFYQNFNLQIDKYDYYEGIIEEPNNPNNFTNNTNTNSNNFIHRDKIIIEKIKDALNIYEEYILPKNENSEEESVEEGLDASQIKEKESSIKVSGESSLRQTLNNPQIKPPIKDSDNSSSLKNNDTAKLATPKQVIPNSPKQKFNFSITQISDKEKINFYKNWYIFNMQYNYYLCRLFYRERTVKRKNPENELREIQLKFIKFLSESKEQKIIINQFIQKYKTFRDNYCKSNKINKSSNITIINNYQKDLVELNETLWDIAKIRKNQAFEEIAKLEKENYIGVELKFIYFKMERLIILETQKLILIINMFIRYYVLSINPKIFLTKNSKLLEFSLDILLSNEIIKNVNEEEFAVQKERGIIYPRANRLYKNCFRVLIKIYIFLEKCFAFLATKDKKNMNISTYKTIKTKKNKTKNTGIYASAISYTPNIPQAFNTTKMDLQTLIKAMIKTHINKYKYNMYNLYLNTLENLSKIYCPFKQVIKMMDYWIILSMELQNKKIKETLQILDLTNNYKKDANKNKNKNIDPKLEEEIETKIVDSIIKDSNNIFNFEFTGISEENFPLFDKNQFLGSTARYEIKNETDSDSLKLYDLFKEYDILAKLRNNEIQKGIITKSKFEEIFFKFFLYDNIDKFPKAFQNIDYHNISTFLSHFVFLSSEFRKNKSDNNDINEGEPQELIYTNDIITILLLSGICFDIYKENDNHKDIDKDKYIDKDAFMKTKFEFEKEIKKLTNKSKDIKTYLFSINKNNSENPEINLKQFIGILTLKSIKNAPKEIKKYFYLFDS